MPNFAYLFASVEIYWFYWSWYGGFSQKFFSNVFVHICLFFEVNLLKKKNPFIAQDIYRNKKI